MEIIHVPPPSKDAFHKGRPVSDLIKAQVRHFKQVEAKLSPEQQQSIPQHRITTENEAAVYITAMTRLLRSGVSRQPGKPKTIPVIAKKSAAPRQAQGLAIAASAARSAKTRKKSATKKK